MSLIRNIRNSVPSLFRKSRRSRKRGAPGVEPLEARQLLTATPIAELSDEFDDNGSTEKESSIFSGPQSAKLLRFYL